MPQRILIKLGGQPDQLLWQPGSHLLGPNPCYLFFIKQNRMAEIRVPPNVAKIIPYCESYVSATHAT